ncbi:high mobility group protein, putative [Perkinsus marinus ATCC 50983]|uniref:High mobility group protein, putative n=1 Tax=Perkinsus marinus (strain ATCC 50983 / TXsc) TaxID=423536 RepID=C5L209_PERM5|nr:high mobility group protein, putative [Perkinsus marinus ATCC 50983]EER09234.1 high mobility group protein, putative [Perkinsus marinus ATCC 50983]|eukprot:XP_002777418.1 high mobility group protein, putative [Perkinsus marinus ATCC 50983]
MAATKKSTKAGASPVKVKKTTKGKKDDGKPKVKRALSAYFIFMQKNRQKIMEENGLQPKDIGEIAKKTGEMWKGMSEAEKAPYNKMADEDKQRYEREKAAVGV